MNNIGYCCISVGINEGKRKKDFITVNRGMTKKTFDTKGLNYVSELVILNLIDTLKVLEWNVRNKIFVYRMSSDSFPWMTNYEFTDLPKFTYIKSLLESIGKYVKSNNIRTSFHPSHFCVIASENPNVVLNTINDLNKHAEIMDLIGLDKTTYYPINIHINTTKPTREEAAKRFCENFQLLSDSCKSRLTVENDDSPNQYSVKMLYDMVYKNIGVPIVFDQHHYHFGPQDQTMEESLKLAYSTWNTKPMTHMSSSRKIEDIMGKTTAHADFIYEEIQNFGLIFDTELECKQKDLALFKYRSQFLK